MAPRTISQLGMTCSPLSPPACSWSMQRCMATCMALLLRQWSAARKPARRRSWRSTCRCIAPTFVGAFGPQLWGMPPTAGVTRLKYASRNGIVACAWLRAPVCAVCSCNGGTASYAMTFTDTRSAQYLFRHHTTPRIRGCCGVAVQPQQPPRHQRCGSKPTMTSCAFRESSSCSSSSPRWQREPVESRCHALPRSGARA
jgi:hypothetical protein